jgi:hypothetical protein
MINCFSYRKNFTSCYCNRFYTKNYNFNFICNCFKYFISFYNAIFASNKIFITVTGNLYIDANGGYGLATIFRGATNLGDATYGMASVYAASSTVIGSMSMSVLDSPSTTSATTYQVYIKRYGGNNVYIQEPVGKSSITAFD